MSSVPLPGVKVEDPEDPLSKENLARYKGKAESQHFDPCDAAAKRSYKCLYRNPKDKDMCSDYFQAYRDCKKRWLDYLKEEKRRGSS